MKITYDKEKAIQTKREIDERFDKKYTPAKRSLRIVLCALCLVAVFLSLVKLGNFISNNIASKFFMILLLWVNGILMLISIVAGATVVESICHRTVFDSYPNAIKYHTLINLPNKTILNTDAHLTIGGMNNREVLLISVDVENPDHTVITERFRISCSGHSFDRKYCTDISEKIFDLDEMVIYKPYPNTKEAN